jgi:hypothetical protein
METEHSPASVDVPKELLLEDFKQQCTNLQGQYARMHNRMQLLTGLNTALLPILGTVALASSKGDIGRPWLILFPLAGLLLSAIGYLTGANDRKLVTVYREHLSWTAECLLKESTEGRAEYHRWLHVGLNPTAVEQKLAACRPKAPDQGRLSRWDRMISRRWEPLSVTRLPAVLSLAFMVIWLVLLVLLVVVLLTS